MRPFNLYRRGRIYYCRFKDEYLNKWSSGISTGESNKNAAYAVVFSWERDGIPQHNNRSPEGLISTRRIVDTLRTADITSNEVDSILTILRDRGLIVTAIRPGQTDVGPLVEFLEKPLLEYLTWFWDYDTSEYVANKRRHGHAITRTHCNNRKSSVLRHWGPWLKKNPVTLVTTTRNTLDRFSAYIAEKGLSTQSCNHLLTAATAALSYAYDMRAISQNPAEGITFYSVKHEKRGTLTADEIRGLFSFSWPSDSAKLASLVAATTGMRAGEIAALTIDDIGEDRLHVRYSWSRLDGLKSTKTGESRYVPLIPSVRARLLEYASKNPHGGPFVFWSTEPDRPTRPEHFYYGFREALAMLSGMSAEEVRMAHRAQANRGGKKLSKEQVAAKEKLREVFDVWIARGVSFHSWRHHYATTMANIVDRRAMIATGHRSQAIFEQYADHATNKQFQEVADAAMLAFGKVLEFPGQDCHEAEMAQ